MHLRKEVAEVILGVPSYFEQNVKLCYYVEKERLSYLFDSHVIDIYSTDAIPDFAAWLFPPFAMSATLLGILLRKKLKKQ